MARKCKYCSETIDWENRDGKWFPINMDGTDHRRHSKEEMAKAVDAMTNQPPEGEPLRTKPCRTCQEPIYFKQIDGKWRALSLDHTRHSCERDLRRR